MLRQRSSSPSTRWFKPALEPLEDRIVPAGLNLGQIGQQFLNDAKQAVVNQVQNVAESEAFLLQNGQVTGEQLNRDTDAFNKDPHNLNTLISMAKDTGQLVDQAITAYAQLRQLAQYLATAENTGLVTGFQATALEAALNFAQNQVNVLLEAASQALDNMDAAVFGFLSGKVDLPEPLPQPPPSSSSSSTPSSPPAGSVSENITDAPKTASATGGPITESVTVNNSTGSDVHMNIKYTSTDGSTASASDDCTNSTVTLPLQVNPSAAGNTGTWTVSVTGEPDQSNTTSYV
ncbi:MAG TPA: hypothetical protein VH592_11525 [Gemmataceae bacterium]|jgi:hypothetical protein